MNAASERSGEIPWVLLIDTALERGSRVTRDDGEHLSELAEAARDKNVFIGVALDDDIAGADGSNSAIVRSFSIDYLDQAHLYKVVNAHVFPKESHKQAILHEIYGYFREVLPSFRWSEQKFSSLYPLHPAILEVAPYVRLYVHEFALLGFASEAGERILGRPANSLIALDEVYDNAEPGLRKIDDLQEAFTAYDTINSTVVNKIPVMQRLQAKLILKALLLLSLDGQGGTASEICASELIFDEAEPDKAVGTVNELLRMFAEALPNDFRVTTEEGVEARYSFKVVSKENLNNALSEAVMRAPADSARSMLRRVFQERFPESVPGNESQEGPFAIAAELIWRGAMRKGTIRWPNPDGGTSELTAAKSPWADWEVDIDLDGGLAAEPGPANEIARIIWKPDPLRPDEIEKLRSYYVLASNAELREKYSEQIRAAVHAHSMAAEKILTRSFLEDAKLVIDGFDYNFTEEARSAQTLSNIFGSMLEPLFETRYPSHPYFTRTLEYADVASIVTDLYNGTRRDLADAQSRAQTYAFPLGLVRLEGTSFVPETPERLAALAFSREVLEFVEKSAGRSVSLDEVYAKLRKPPFGLGRDAQQMVLTALVAERFIEFVTTSGNRINSRSLDLKIIWDDIAGVAKPGESASTGETLKRWAKLFLTETSFESFDRAESREALTNAFAKWSGEWAGNRVLERFAELPEETLNVRLWQLSARLAKTFGTVAEKIRGAAEGAVPLEECLSRVAEAFSGSETEFNNGEHDLKLLTNFVKAAEMREQAREYIGAAEVTEVDEIERSRQRTSALLAASLTEHNEDLDRELSYAWEKFRREYADHFSARHAERLSTQEHKVKFNEILKSQTWAEFDILSKLAGFEQKYASAARDLRRQMADVECAVATNQLLGKQPFCHCGFSLRCYDGPEFLLAALNDTIHAGLSSFRSMLTRNSDDLASKIEKIAEGNGDPDVISACRELVSALKSGNPIPRLGDLQLKVLAEVIQQPNGLDLARSTRPRLNSETFAANENLSFGGAAPTEFADESNLLLV